MEGRNREGWILTSHRPRRLGPTTPTLFLDGELAGAVACFDRVREHAHRERRSHRHEPQRLHFEALVDAPEGGGGRRAEEAGGGGARKPEQGERLRATCGREARRPGGRLRSFICGVY